MYATELLKLLAIHASILNWLDSAISESSMFDF